MTTYSISYQTTDDSTNDPWAVAESLGLPRSHRSLTAARKAAARANAANASTAEIYDEQGSLVLRVDEAGDYRAP